MHAHVRIEYSRKSLPGNVFTIPSSYSGELFAIFICASIPRLGEMKSLGKHTVGAKANAVANGKDIKTIMEI